MKKLETKQKDSLKMRDDRGQRGSALVIAVFVLILISVFVAMALSRTSSEAAAIGNETTEGRTFYAAQGSLEMMTRNFNKVFEVKISPSNNDLNAVRTGVEPGLTPQFSFVREVERTSDSEPAVLSGNAYAGLYAIRDNWLLKTTATDQSGIQVELTRNILNNRIPIFQFGIFYDDDLELYRPPRFNFGGRVHSNRHFFLSPGTEGVYFDSQVTAAGHIITQTWRNGNQSDINNNQTFIKNASLVDQQLLPTKGSVLNTTAGAADNEFTDPDELDLPPSKLNPNWIADSSIFDGNLKSRVPELNLPLNVGVDTDLIEMIKRGKEIADADGGDLWKNNAQTLVPVTAGTGGGEDDGILRAERFANKTGIRVSLADSKAKLPGCASGVGVAAINGVCGVMLDGAIGGAGAIPSPTPALIPEQARGYQPKSMKLTSGDAAFNYKATRVNGERLHAGREVWIKVETVQTNVATGAIETKDITQDFLSMGVTEPIPDGVVTVGGYTTTPASFNCADASTCNLNQTTAQTASQGNDSRSVIKIQRFAIPGAPIPGSTYTGTFTGQPAGTTRWLYPYPNNTTTGFNYNFAVRYIGMSASIDLGCPSPLGVATCQTVNETPNSNREFPAHARKIDYGSPCSGLNPCAAIVPFPIKMFDTREGTFYDQANLYRANKVTKNGVMSVIDIDVANLRRFLRGDFNGLFPTDTPFAASKSGVGLVNTDIPQKNGWVLYVSDRRGDEDFDGEYDMEDIYGYGISGGRYHGSDGVLQAGEDVNKNTILDVAFNAEAANKYSDDIDADEAVVTDHKFYRRGVRLINGAVIPGNYDAVTAANTSGFTLASENGVYVYGNYNATHVTSVPATGNTPYENYRPFGKPATATTAAVLAPTHIPASIVADSVTILSNSKYFASGSGLPDYTNGWNDAKSFAFPYDVDKRRATETTIRFAMISGDTIASIQSAPHQGGLSPKLNGGVHNFKRYLERWTDPAVGATFKVNLNYSGSLINLFNSHNNNGSFKCCTTAYNPPIRNWVFDSTFLDPTRLPPGTPFFQYIQTTGFQRINN